MSAAEATVKDMAKDDVATCVSSTINDAIGDDVKAAPSQRVEKTADEWLAIFKRAAHERCEDDLLRSTWHIRAACKALHANGNGKGADALWAKKHEFDKMGTWADSVLNWTSGIHTADTEEDMEVGIVEYAKARRDRESTK